MTKSAYAIGDIRTTIVAPLMVFFVKWILCEAAKRGQDRLYFVSRDGELLLSIAKVLACKAVAPELRYLHGSRRSWLLPSVTSPDGDWRRLVILRGHRNSPKDMLERLFRSEAQVLRVLRQAGIDARGWESDLGVVGAGHFISEMTAHPLVWADIDRLARKDRERAVNYFSQEGLFDSVNWAIVDIGWDLNCQAALRRILRSRSGENSDVSGYYLGFGRRRLPESVTGPAMSFIGSELSIFARSRVLIEHLFTPATHPTVRGYCNVGDSVRPEFGRESRNSAQLEYARVLHRIVMEYAYAIAENRNCDRAADTNATAAVKNASRFLKYPRPDEVMQVSGFYAVADLRHDEILGWPLCRPLSIADAFGLFADLAFCPKAHRSLGFWWVGGSCVLSKWYVRRLVRLMAGIEMLLLRFEVVLRGFLHR